MIMTGLVPLTARHASSNLSEVPMIGKLRVSFFQALEKKRYARFQCLELTNK